MTSPARSSSGWDQVTRSLPIGVFGNKVAFNDPTSRSRTLGVDFNPKRPIVDPRGNALAYAQAGGIR
jgi:hypothetical protein